MKLSDIKPNPNNPRIIKDDKYKKLVQSIKEFPEMAEVREIVVNKDNIILGGNMRYKAMIEAGWKEAPVRVVDWSPEKQREFVIKDNVSGGEWDWDLLANDYDKQELEDWGMDVDKWADDEVVEDEAPEVSQEPAISVLGEVYQLGRHRIMCGDSTKIEDVEKLMDGQKADMVFTDPPYGMDYGGGRAKGEDVKFKRGGGIKSFGQIANDDLSGDNLVKFIVDSMSVGITVNKSGGATYVCGTWRTTKDYYSAFVNMGITPKAVIVWDKGHVGLGYADYRPQHEFIYYFSGQWYGDKSESDLWSFTRGDTGEYVHPTQKPVALCAKGLQNSSKQDDIVLDLFLGSGSTLIACEQTNRTCYGMELDPKYVDVIRKRYAKFTHPDDWEDKWQTLTPALQ